MHRKKEQAKVWGEYECFGVERGVEQEQNPSDSLNRSAAF
jgi:hypothetical protein